MRQGTMVAENLVSHSFQWVKSHVGNRRAGPRSTPQTETSHRNMRRAGGIQVLPSPRLPALFVASLTLEARPIRVEDLEPAAL